MYNADMKRRFRRRSPLPSLDLTTLPVLLAVVLVPAFFNIQSSVSFEPDKAMLVHSLTGVLALAWLALAWQQRSRLREHWQHIPLPLRWLAVSAGAWLLATAFSLDLVSSFWGNHERGLGLLSLLSALLLTVGAYRLVQMGRFILLVDAAILGSLAPALYAILQVLGYDPVIGHSVSFALGQRASSTPGNPLFLADYLLLVLPLTLARLGYKPRPRGQERVLLLLAAFLQLAALVAAGSLTALGAGAAAAAFGLFAQGRLQARRRLTWAGLLILAGGMVALLVSWLFPGLLPARLGQIFAGGSSGGQRLLFWQATAEALRAHPSRLLIGFGADTLPLALPPFLPPTIAHFEVDWAFRIPDRAHTWLLDALSTGGILAVAAELVLWTTALAALIGVSSWRRWALPLLTAGISAIGGSLLFGLGAVPPGLIAGWLAGWLWLLLRSGRDARPVHPWSPAVLAALVGHWVFLSFSFRTHAADVLAWSLLGVAVALAPPAVKGGHAVGDGAQPLLGWLAGAAFAIFGYALSAAWPRALPLWLYGGALLLLPVMLLPAHGSRRTWQRFLIPTLVLLPALLLNRYTGLPAWLAYAWLLGWLLFLLGQAVPLAAAQQRLLLVGAALLLLINLPQFGDIAYKSALLFGPLSPTGRAWQQRALALSPYDHDVALGLASTAAAGDNTGADPRIRQLYQTAIAAQPQAVGPRAAYAEWLRRQAQGDPAITDAALRVFEQVLHMSPHDIESRNRLALLHWQTGDSERAMADLQALLAEDPLYGPTYLNLAQIQLALGQRAAARQTLQAGVEHVPWWPALADALATLPPPAD